ncbi:MAG: hypothetical protein ACSHYF_02285 [Verrucomicrobiaceae bacterium]
MKITPDDPRLTAYVLGELSEEDSECVRRTISNEAALAEAEQEIEGMVSLLRETLGGERGLGLGADRREAIFQAGRQPDAEVILLENRRRVRFQTLGAIAGVAAVITLGVYLLAKTPVSSSPAVIGQEEGRGESGKTEVAGVESSVAGSSDTNEVVLEEGGISESGVPAPVSDERVEVQDLVSLQIPLSVKHADLASFERTLRKGEIPSTRVEEWVNAGNYGTEAMVRVNGVGASVELGECPWNPGRALIFVVIQDLLDDGISPRMKARLLMEGEQVESVGLVVSKSVRGDLADMQTLASSEATALLYEVELTGNEGRTGAIDLEVMGVNGEEKNSYLPVMGSPVPVRATSAAFQTAVTLARFAKWQNAGASDVGELEQVVAGARNLLTVVEDSRTRYALDLILLTSEAISEKQD